MQYEVAQKPATVAIHGEDGTMLVSGNATVAWERDALSTTCDALNSGEITEAEALEFASKEANRMMEANIHGK